MRHNENKAMRCFWYAFLMVIVMTFLVTFGWEMRNGTAFGMKGGRRYDACEKTEFVNRSVLYI